MHAVNKIDLNLLARVSRHLKAQATQAHARAAEALNTPEYRRLKDLSDRLHRDIRDLDDLRRKLNGAVSSA